MLAPFESAAPGDHAGFPPAPAPPGPGPAAAGLPAPAPVAPERAAAPAAAGGDAGGEAEADDAPVDIHLSEVGDKKVDVIKAVRAITGLGLKDAKAMVDEAPSVIKEGVNKAEADEHAKALQDAGATVELK